MSTVTFEIDGALGTITIANPPLNLMTRDMIADFEEAVTSASTAPIRALLIRAEGPHFMGGADVSIFSGVSASGARAMFARAIPVFQRIEELPIPVVAAAQGLCLAAGLEVVLFADIIVAAESARFAQVERHIGTTTLLGGAQRLAERAGAARARQIVFDGEQYSAAQFAEWNIVNHVVRDDELGARAEKLARHYAAGPTRALGAGKSLVRGYLDGGMRTADRLVLDVATPLFETTDMRNGVATFLANGTKAIGTIPFEGA